MGCSCYSYGNACRSRLDAGVLSSGFASASHVAGVTSKWHDNWISDVFRLRCMRDVYISRAYGLLRLRCAPGVVSAMCAGRRLRPCRCLCHCDRLCQSACRPRAAVWPHGCVIVATHVVQRVSSVCVCGPFYLRKYHVCVKCCVYVHTWCTVDLTDARCLQLIVCCLLWHDCISDIALLVVSGCLCSVLRATHGLYG